MSSSRDRNPKIFIAKLSPNLREDDLDYYFRKYGHIRNLQLRKGYALFVTFGISLGIPTSASHVPPTSLYHCPATSMPHATMP